MKKAFCIGMCAAAIIIISAAVAQSATAFSINITTLAEAMYKSADGITMPSAKSNAVTLTVNGTALAIGEAKCHADNQTVYLQSSIVTAGTGDMGGAFYMQSSNRSSGIRVVTSQSILEGDMVTVAGTICTVNGERQITASGVQIVSSDNACPKPLGINQALLNKGHDNSGLLVSVWGRIKSAPAGSGYFYVCDGSSLNDGTGNIGVRVRGTAPSSPVGKYVMVTGISAFEMQGTTKVRVIKVRRAGDVSVLSALP